jgi:general secretion pathway protein A
MYNHYFHFSDSPFVNNYDQRFMYMNQDYESLFTTILHTIIEKRKLIILSGARGTGKTILIHHLVDNLPPSLLPVIISSSKLETTGIMKEVAQKLRISLTDNFLELHELENTLKELDSHQKHIVLIVDDAQVLSDRDLGEIGLIHLIEKNEQQLVAVLLVGQGSRHFQVDHQTGMNNAHCNSLKFRMPSLNESETINYIDHRLRQVGSSFDACFEPDTRDLIFHLAAGVPSRINQVCDQALQSAMGAKFKKVNRALLEKMRPGEPPGLQFTRENKGLGKPLVALILGVIIIVGALASFNGVLGNWWQHSFAKKDAVALKYKDHQVKEINQEKVSAKGIQNPVTKKILPPPIVSANVNIKHATVSPTPEIDSQDQQVKETSKAAVPAAATENPVKKEPLPPPIEPENINNNSMLSKKPEIDRGNEAQESEAEKAESITQRVVRPHENLTNIVAEHYQEYEPLGYQAVILANPDIMNENLITPGQVLYLPVIDYRDEEIQLQDNLFYTPYGLYYSEISMQKDLVRLTNRKIKYLVRRTRQLDGIMAYRIYLGGYETQKALQEAKRQIQMESK